MLEHWYQALRSAHGIVLSSEDRERLRGKLYEARRDAADRDLECLGIVLSPTDPNELWIVKKDATPEVK